MGKEQVRVTLREKGCIIKRWEHLCQTDLPEVIEAVKMIKVSLNDYLTMIIGQDVNLTDFADICVEDEEVKDDSISGFIKEAVVEKKRKECGERKINYLHHPKKFRK